MLAVYVATGLAFMLLPGTFVGVLNLMKIASAHAATAVDASWVQAQSHAQLFGWLGTFIPFIVAIHGDAPVFPASFNQRYLVLVTWGFSSRWLPPLLGLKKT